MRKIMAILLALLICSCASAASASSLLEENFALLESLGIEVPENARNDIRTNIEETLNNIPDDIKIKFGRNADSFSDIVNILSWLGYGDYDYETRITTHYTDDVYAFDTEMFDIEGAYTELLDAVERMSGGAADIENCKVQISEELFIKGYGKFPITFEMNGKAYEYSAKLEHDWMDYEFIDYINSVLAQQGMPKQLWTLYGVGQGPIVFYCDAIWAKEFEAATGYELTLGTGSTFSLGLLTGLLDLFF